MQNKISLAVFILAVVAIGSAIGLITAPGEWYAGLNKPFFNPPAWVFGPVWTTLYVMIAIAGWRVWNGPQLETLRNLWFLQMGLNFIWSPIFFGLQNLGLALVVIVILWGVIVSFILRAWTYERVSAMLFLPYLAWVSFATLLNASLWWLN